MADLDLEKYLFPKSFELNEFGKLLNDSIPKLEPKWIDLGRAVRTSSTLLIVATIGPFRMLLNAKFHVPLFM